MPENVHAGNGRYDILDKTRGKAGYAAYFDAPIAISSKKKDSRALACGGLEVSGNGGKAGYPFFGCHRTDNAADDAVGRPAELIPPAARDERWRRILDSGMDNDDPLRVDTTLDHRIFHGVRDGDETRYAIPVFEPRGLWNEWDAPRDDEWWALVSDQRHASYRMRARVVCVNDVGVEFANSFSNASRCPEIQVRLHRGRLGVETGERRAPEEWRVRGRDNQRLVPSPHQPRGEQQYLSLTTAPLAPGVNVKNSKPFQSSSSRFAKARKIPRSHGSGESFISSGCHCTAIAHQASLSLSTPSMIPSGARAVTLKPSAGSRILW